MTSSAKVIGCHSDVTMIHSAIFKHNSECVLIVGCGVIIPNGVRAITPTNYQMIIRRFRKNARNCQESDVPSNIVDI